MYVSGDEDAVFVDRVGDMLAPWLKNHSNQDPVPLPTWYSQ